MLKRMGRVKSDEAAEPRESSQPQGEVIGAGLPLLQRLLLLKAREDKEDKDKPKEDQVLVLFRVLVEISGFLFYVEFVF
jgi:hypothetical protein